MASEYWILNRLAITPLNHRAVSRSTKNSKSLGPRCLGERSLRSLGHLHLQSHLVRPTGVADQQLELLIFRRRELHFTFRARTGVLADHFLILVVDEQMHVRLLVTLRRGNDLLAGRERQDDGELALILHFDRLALELCPLALVGRLDLLRPHAVQHCQREQGGQRAHLPVLPGHNFLLLVAPAAASAEGPVPAWNGWDTHQADFATRRGCHPSSPAPASSERRPKARAQLQSREGDAETLQMPARLCQLQRDLEHRLKVR